MLHYDKPLTNDKVSEFLKEYEREAQNRGLSLRSHIEKIYFIVVEPESNIPPQLTNFNLGKVDKKRKLILLSKI